MSFNSTDAASTIKASGIALAFAANALVMTIGFAFLVVGLLGALGYDVEPPDMPASMAQSHANDQSEETDESSQRESASKEESHASREDKKINKVAYCVGLVFGTPLFCLIEAAFLASNISILRLIVTDSPTLQGSDFTEWWLYCLQGIIVLLAMIFGLLAMIPISKFLTRPWRKTKCAVCAAHEADDKTETLPIYEAQPDQQSS